MIIIIFTVKAARQTNFFTRHLLNEAFFLARCLDLPFQGEHLLIIALIKIFLILFNEIYLVKKKLVDGVKFID